jgi:hypothetical protein
VADNHPQVVSPPQLLFPSVLFFLWEFGAGAALAVTAASTNRAVAVTVAAAPTERAVAVTVAADVVTTAMAATSAGDVAASGSASAAAAVALADSAAADSWTSVAAAGELPLGLRRDLRILTRRPSSAFPAPVC